jgi:hypothetical protein
MSTIRDRAAGSYSPLIPSRAITVPYRAYSGAASGAVTCGSTDQRCTAGTRPVTLRLRKCVQRETNCGGQGFSRLFAVFGAIRVDYHAVADSTGSIDPARHGVSVAAWAN